MCELTTSASSQASLWEDCLPEVDVPPSLGPSLDNYDRFVVFHSGGKDSIACILHLLDLGVPTSKIELHHHDVDGREGSRLMDWPITRSYCAAFARVFGLKIVFSWKEGGFEREMLRENKSTAPTHWMRDGLPDGQSGGESAKQSTRRKFPQVSADLNTRWCSSYLKIMVGSALINGEERFLNGKTLVITGERAQESSARARYKTFEPHRTDNRHGARIKRWIDHWRPVHGWDEKQVWELLKKYRVNPHPCYWLGWGRCSCMKCIFGSANQWASVQKIDPIGFDVVANYEEEFGTTIQRSLSVRQLANKGQPYEMDDEMMALAMSSHYPDNLILVSGEWRLPPGAFGETNGPL